ncbi:DUF4358 domain-containing protein [Acidaminobacterium chupaoyuni]
MKKRTWLLVLVAAGAVLAAGCAREKTEDATDKTEITQESETPSAHEEEKKEEAETPPAETPSAPSSPETPVSSNTADSSKKPAPPAQKPSTPAGQKPQQPSTPSPDVPPAKQPPTPASLTASLCGSYDSLPTVSLKDSVVKSLYDLDFSKVESFSVKAPAMNVEASELAVFKAASSADVSAIRKALEARAAAVQNTFEQYDPQQYEIAKNAQILTQGNYLLLVMGGDAAAVASSFQALLAE